MSLPDGEEAKQFEKIKPIPKQNPYIEIVTKRRIRRSTIRGKLTRYQNLKADLERQLMKLRQQIENTDKIIEELTGVLNHE